VLFVRIIAPALKPALVGGVVLTAAAGGWFALDRLHGDSLTPFEAIQDDGQLLLVSEFGETADTIVAVDPEDTARRDEIAQIRHAPGYGVFASISPDGTAIAYTALPEDEPEPSPATPAIAGIVGAAGEVEVLAKDIDLLVTPVWSPDSAAVVVRRNTPIANSAGMFELLLLGRDGARTTLVFRDGSALFPIAFSPDGARLYFATLDASGTDLWSVAAAGGGETAIAHLSDEIARDWKLSPDGGTIAYTVAESGPQPRITTMTIDLASFAQADAVAAPDQQLEFNPAWAPDGDLTVASVDPESGAGAAVAVADDGSASVIASTADGVDLPLQWSPDGETLAVRAVAAPGAGDAESHIAVVTEDGDRERVSSGADVLIVGWLE
jgi:Tol biopolymer transport system component